MNTSLPVNHCDSVLETPKLNHLFSMKTGQNEQNQFLMPGELAKSTAVELSCAQQQQPQLPQRENAKLPPQSQKQQLQPQPSNPSLPSLPSSVSLERFEGRKPISQILEVSEDNISAFCEMLNSFREQDYFHIHAQKTRNQKLKKAATELANN
jgi:hypothetical protein